MTKAVRGETHVAAVRGVQLKREMRSSWTAGSVNQVDRSDDGERRGGIDRGKRAGNTFGACAITLQ